MNTIQFFEGFLLKVMETSQWQTMRSTVEDSPWHRESDVARHTLMTLDVYLNKFAKHRTEREQMLSLMALCFHDFGKPEAEETLEKKDQPGVMYRRYAGHEPISGNEFMNFICDQHALRQSFFAQGYGWYDVRTIKFMIEHHLPYGLKNPQKRLDLRQTIALTMQDNEAAFWDMLRSDAAGRISDDHEKKLQDVEDFIEPFKALPFNRTKSANNQPTLYVLIGPSGAGKSTWTKKLVNEWYLEFTVVSEDEYRLRYAEMNMDHTDQRAWSLMTPTEQYAAAWKFCHLNPDSRYDEYARAEYAKALNSGKDIVLDRTNQTRKSRSPWIQAAKQHGYAIQSVEFYISENQLNFRQETRTDKSVPLNHVHQMVMRMEVPWYGPEVDFVQVVPQV
jgi:predicted kinase